MIKEKAHEEFERLIAAVAEKKIVVEDAREREAAARYSAQRLRSEEWVRDGLQYAEKIFDWGKKFKASLLGQATFAAMESFGKNGKSLVLYSIKGRRDIPIIQVVELGIISYYGHRYDGELVNNSVADSPITLALWASPEFLKKTWEVIENGQVYQEMAAHFNWQMGIWNAELERIQKRTSP